MFFIENILEIADSKTKKSKKSKKMEKIEKCPLCCEELDPDDLNFLPCPCGYKVCLFCWNTIRTNENDPKCPLCRRTYSENPAKFEPLSAEQLQKLKNKKKLEDVKKKQKLAEDRKLLADVRVVRKNLIFVNELPLNFSKDPKSYQRFLSIFKQAGHVKKVSVLNSSKNYAGQKAPFARAYITYQKNEEALRALKLFEGVEFEGRELKLSLGTTKYCSSYIKNVTCVMKECVYLHEQADAEASFTKEQIQAGKHIEYGQRLYEQYVQYVNNMHSKSISNSVIEERKSDPQQQHTEELEKENSPENSISAPTTQQSSQLTHNDRSLSPSENDSNTTVFKQLQDIMMVANISDSTLSTNSSSHNNHCDSVLKNLSREQCVPQTLIPMNSPVNNSSSSSMDLGGVNKSAEVEFGENVFEEKFVVKRETPPVIPNGNLFHEERYSAKESLLTRLMNSHKDNNIRCSETFSPFNQDLDVLTLRNHLINNDGDRSAYSFEPKDDCGLDFDPVQTALGGLGELVVSEKQKARIEVNSLNTTPINAFKKHNAPQQRVQQPVFSPNNYLPVYQNRSQNSPIVDFYNQTSFRPSVQSPVGRSSLHSQTVTPTQQRSQPVPPPFANTLTIQTPRFSPGMSVGNNSMVNGYSPQHYMSAAQVSPPDAFMMSQQQQQQPPQQNHSFENFPQHQFSFEQQVPSFGSNMSLGQRIRNETLSRQQSYQQQQQYQQLQRLNSYCNSTPLGGSLNRPNGNNTFP
ncbi:myb-like protein Z isoform X1 [Parasteatoda tepidariorum]|uniref:myb-like protein Z isoform X1 n=1 Tax=Parasteatoda tepidariorum TaxID=114398 RepID=UPI001C721162|nr:uncharacterized protein LOC107450683 isoform X1 [Parasteatoda tepidariorum]